MSYYYLSNDFRVVSRRAVFSVFGLLGLSIVVLSTLIGEANSSTTTEVTIKELTEQVNELRLTVDMLEGKLMRSRVLVND